MAFRIDQAIVRGEITNEVPGIITGKIWLVGREKPIVLQLEGNGQTDLAGSALTFQNPLPQPQVIDGLATHQVGRSGTMTASQKIRVPTVPDDDLTQLIQSRQPVPSRWANCLYLEWFSDANGRVVVQAENFELTLSEPCWSLPEPPPSDTSDHPGSNPFLNRGDDGEADPFTDPGDGFLSGSDLPFDDDFDDEPLDEFEWEQELRDADLRADAYQEALEQFHDHVTDQRDAPELTAPNPDPDGQLPLTSERDASGDPSPKHHELTIRALEIATTLRDEARRHQGLAAPAGRPDSPDPVAEAIAATVQFGGRLAAALDGVANGADPENGFIIAMLKRSLEPLNSALGHCSDAIVTHGAVPALVVSAAETRSNLFDLRRDILDLMAELRSGA